MAILESDPPDRMAHCGLTADDAAASLTLSLRLCLLFPSVLLLLLTLTLLLLLLLLILLLLADIQSKQRALPSWASDEESGDVVALVSHRHTAPE